MKKVLKWGGIGVGGFVGVIIAIGVVLAALEDFAGITLPDAPTPTPAEIRAEALEESRKAEEKARQAEEKALEEAPEPEHSAVGAWVVCQQFLEGQLKSPASAKYPSGYPDYTTHLGAGQYRVAAYVDSQNAFGAMIRTDFTCMVQHTQGDTYSLVSLDFP